MALQCFEVQLARGPDEAAEAGRVSSVRGRSPGSVRDVAAECRPITAHARHPSLNRAYCSVFASGASGASMDPRFAAGDIRGPHPEVNSVDAFFTRVAKWT